MTEETKDDLKLREEHDGSVIVGGEEPPKKEAVPVEDDHEDESLKAESDDEHAPEGETEAEADERRERNRQRRAENKQRRKDYIESLKREIAARDEVLNETMRRLEIVERRSQGADVAMVEAELQKTTEAYNYFKQVHADAVTAADGARATEAQENMLRAVQRAQQLEQIREASRRPQTQSQPLDPRLKAHAEDWMSRNSWYDPNGADPDSEIALTIDRQLAREGWNPTTSQYWEELDSRVKKYLPHRSNSGHNSHQADSRSRPRAPVAGSGRETSATTSGGYKLSPERVQALKDSGNWDDPKQRAEAIRRYQEYDKQQGAR